MEQVASQRAIGRIFRVVITERINLHVFHIGRQFYFQVDFFVREQWGQRMVY